MNKPPSAANDWKRPRSTASGVIRRAIIAMVALVSLAAFAIGALPVVASTQIVKDRIAIELSAWSGFRVKIASTPQIEVWPSFKAVLSGVTLYQWGNWNNPAVIEAERVEIDMSALEALNGNASFSQVKLVNPVVRLGVGTNEAGPGQITSSGRIAQAIDAVRELIGDDPDHPPLDRFPTAALAGLEIQNGRIVSVADGKETDIVTRLSGLVEWPALNAAGQVSLSGEWRGEQVKIDVSSPSPLALFAGGATSIAGNVNSALFNGSANGQIRATGNGVLKAHIEAEAPDMRRALAWANVDIATGSALKSLKLSGDVDGTRDLLTVAKAKLAVNSQTGAGDLTLSMLPQHPKLVGKLSFTQIDLESLASLFTPIWLYDAPQRDMQPLSARIDLGLSIAAAKAKLGAAQLNDLTGQITIEGGATTFQIVQAKAFDGAVQGSLALLNELDQPRMELGASATGINGTKLADGFGIPSLTPDAAGDANLRIAGKSHALDKILASGNGRLTAHFGAGKIDGLDLTGLVSKAANNGFFPASEVATGTLPIDSADLDAAIENGVGRVREAKVISGQKTILLSGIMPSAGRGVALSGAVSSMDKISLFNPFGREATFFVGGSWDEPFVSAALPSQLPPPLPPQ